ncbi:MAG: hypothetical protein AAFX97_02865 [Pseudomonadota bacterium]
MSDSLENMAEMQNEVTQPVDVVVTDTEETSSPQTGDEEIELYIEAEGDQTEEPKTNMSQEQAYAAFRKEKEKRQRKNEELEAASRREKELLDRLAKLEGTVGGIAKGAPPTLESCDYDEQLFAQKMQEYYAPKSESQKPVEQTNQAAQQHINDEDDFYLYQKEQELSKSIPTYEQEKAGLIEQFKQYGGNEQNIAHLTSIGRQRGVDVAKAFVGLNKNPSLVRKLSEAYATQNPFALADVLAEAEKKVRLQARKPLDTQPEPTIPNGGRTDLQRQT